MAQRVLPVFNKAVRTEEPLIGLGTKVRLVFLPHSFPYKQLRGCRAGETKQDKTRQDIKACPFLTFPSYF